MVTTLPKPPGRKKFINHINRFQQQLDLLAEFQTPAVKTWLIDWHELEAISLSGKCWPRLQVFKELQLAKPSPAVYFFTTVEPIEEPVYMAFRSGKAESSKRRLSTGVQDKNFLNVCHIPKQFKITHCLYAGSVKADLYGRLISHLGYGAQRTGALFLKQALDRLNEPPAIYFRYCILPPKFRNVTEHIERIFQDHLDPLLGQKALKSMC